MSPQKVGKIVTSAKDVNIPKGKVKETAGKKGVVSSPVYVDSSQPTSKAGGKK